MRLTITRTRTRTRTRKERETQRNDDRHAGGFALGCPRPSGYRFPRWNGPLRSDSIQKSRAQEQRRPRRRRESSVEREVHIQSGISRGEGQYKLVLKIMDKDTFSADDFLGQASIYLEDLLALGVENGKAELHPCKYRVVRTDQTYCGEIRVGINFTPKVKEEKDEIQVGGWKESDY
ncbi:Elicitor-responsive protein 1 [Vitis vinifera]|uniref:Elicitor-responsive protein 1 n=1 Tax=Vitis vinifera TaxID=29760 RepID=A0A438JY37_VITVI|nr:Elicitor-responsive protein 1 [Vitis vinifera]